MAAEQWQDGESSEIGPGRRVRLAPRWAAVLIAVGCVLEAGLVFAHLGSAALWDDEACVAIFARNLVRFGALTAWDGRNLYAYRDGAAITASLTSIKAPLAYILAAGSFKLFGVSTWSARLPFSLCGLSSLFVFFRILRRDFHTSPAVWAFALLAFGLSAEFLLNVRSACYYAPALLFSQLLYWAYKRFLDNRKLTDCVLMAAAAVGLFYSNFLLCGAFLLALATTHCLLRAQGIRPIDWTMVGLAACVFLCATVPYAVADRIWYQPDIQYHEAWLPHHARLLVWNFRDLNLAGLLPWPAVIGVAWVYGYRRQGPAVLCSGREWLILACAYIAYLSLLSPQLSAIPAIADIRYDIPAAPFFAGVVAVVLAAMWRSSRWAAGIVLLVLVCTNGLSLAPGNRQLRWLLPAYVQEVAAAYPTAASAVSDYLLAHARQDDLLYVDPDYMDYPLQFYVGDRVKLCCQLDERSTIPASTVDKLGAPLLLDRNFPDWIVCFGDQPGAGEMLKFFTRPYPVGGRLVSQSYTMADVIPIFWKQTQRPELPWHEFGPVRHFDRETNSVFILERIRG